VIFFRFGPYILLNIRLSKIAILFSSPLVVGRVSQAYYKRTGLIITLYIIVFDVIDTCFDLNMLVNP